MENLNFETICLDLQKVPEKSKTSYFHSLSEDECKEYLINFIETDPLVSKTFQIFIDSEGHRYESDTDNSFGIKVRLLHTN